MLSAGRLRHRVAIQERNQVDNGRGGRRTPDGEDAWRTVASGVFAEVIALRGEEAMRHAVERSVQIWKVTVRPRPGVTTKHRLVWGALTMDIKGAALSVAGDELVITCESGATGA